MARWTAAFGCRAHKGEVVLLPQLRTALAALNLGASPEALRKTEEELCRDRSSQSLVSANRDIFHLLRDGVLVTVSDTGEPVHLRVRVIAWDTSTPCASPPRARASSTSSNEFASSRAAPRVSPRASASAAPRP